MQEKSINAPVVVLGSKPGAPLPAVAAPVALAANNAVELAALYRDKYGSKVIGMVPLKDLKVFEHIQQSFLKAKPDEIVIMGGEEKESLDFLRNTLGFTATPITVLSFNEVNWQFIKVLGWRRWLVALKRLKERGIKHALIDALSDLAGRRDLVWMHRSTGLNGVLYALQRYPNAPQIISAGMGLQAGTHFNNVGEFTQKVARGDQITMQYWLLRKRARMYTTDDMMHSIGKVPLWEGETFHLSLS